MLTDGAALNRWRLVLGKNAQQQLPPPDKGAKKIRDEGNPFHVADEQEKEDKGQQQKVIHFFEQTSVQEKDRACDQGEHNGPGQYPGNTEKADQEKQQPDSQLSGTVQFRVLGHGGGSGNVSFRGTGQERG